MYLLEADYFFVKNLPDQKLIDLLGLASSLDIVPLIELLAARCAWMMRGILGVTGEQSYKKMYKKFNPENLEAVEELERSLDKEYCKLENHQLINEHDN